MPRNCKQNLQDYKIQKTTRQKKFRQRTIGRTMTQNYMTKMYKTLR